MAEEMICFICGKKGDKMVMVRLKNGDVQYAHWKCWINYKEV